jgi:Sec-independent protein translocase protein TatA
MNTFWLKIAGVAIVVVVVIVLIGVLSSSERSRPAAESAGESGTKPKTFYDQVEKDRERFLVEPRPLEEIAEEPAKEPAEQPIKQQVQEQNQPAVSQTPPQPVQPPVKPTQLYFAPLSEIDKIEAERLLNVAVPGRSIGRLPMTGFKLMVDCCRQIIRRWPDSWYAYRAKQLLIDMPERFRQRYKITKEELDISEFTRQRPGTELFNSTVEEESF